MIKKRCPSAACCDGYPLLILPYYILPHFNHNLLSIRELPLQTSAASIRPIFPSSQCFNESMSERIFPLLQLLRWLNSWETVRKACPSFKTEASPWGTKRQWLKSTVYTHIVSAADEVKAIFVSIGGVWASVNVPFNVVAWLLHIQENSRHGCTVSIDR